MFVVGDLVAGMVWLDTSLVAPGLSLIGTDDGVLWPEELIKSEICWVTTPGDWAGEWPELASG